MGRIYFFIIIKRISILFTQFVAHGNVCVGYKNNSFSIHKQYSMSTPRSSDDCGLAMCRGTTVRKSISIYEKHFFFQIYSKDHLSTTYKRKTFKIWQIWNEFFFSHWWKIAQTERGEIAGNGIIRMKKRVSSRENAIFHENYWMCHTASLRCTERKREKESDGVKKAADPMADEKC